MSTITYTDNVTLIPAAWLNDVNTVVYTYFGTGSSLNSPTKLTVAQGIFSSSVTVPTLTASTSVVTPLVQASAGLVVNANAGDINFQTAGTRRWNIINATSALQPDQDNVWNFGSATARIAAGYFTSMVTPSIGNITDSFLALVVNNAIKWTVQPGGNGFGFWPGTDNTQSIGSTSNRVASVVTPIIDSGTTGSLSLKTNNGTTGLTVRNVASGINFLSAQAGAAGNPPIVSAIDSSEANVGIQHYTKGTGTFSIGSDVSGAAPIQFQVLHTASATRFITVTGSNGGNPTLSTTSGSLAITPAVVLGSTLTGPSNMLSPITNSLGADVLLNNTVNYFDGPSIAQGTSGTWFVSGTVTVNDSTGGSTFKVKLWDGTTVIASAETAEPTTSANPMVIALSGFISSPAANLRISVRDSSTTNGKILFNQSGNSKDSTITAIRIA